MFAELHVHARASETSSATTPSFTLQQSGLGGVGLGLNDDDNCLHNSLKSVEFVLCSSSAPTVHIHSSPSSSTALVQVRVSEPEIAPPPKLGVARRRIMSRHNVPTLPCGAIEIGRGCEW